MKKTKTQAHGHGTHKTLFKVLALVALFCAPLVGQAQVRLGLKAAPTLSSVRTINGSDDPLLNANGASAQYIFGVFADVAIFGSENYAIHTGLNLAQKRTGFTETTQLFRATFDDDRRLQYLQVPVALKLYTSELAIDTRLYFMVGVTGEVLIFDSEAAQPVEVLDPLPVDASALVGMGVEYRLGLSTNVFGGISYYRGLANMISGQPIIAYPGYAVKNDVLALEMGIKF